MLRFYVEVARTAFRRQLIYRWANLAGLVTNIFFGAIYSYVVIALYHARHVAAGYSLGDTLRYIWVAQSMIMLVLPFAWRDLMLTIRTGEVVSDMSKPCDFYWYWFSREFGRSIYYLLFRGIPTFVSGMLLFGVGVLFDWKIWFAFTISLVLGIMLGITYRFLSNITAFWIMEARAVILLAEVVAFFFSGNYIPIPFFPDWLRAITDWLPFSGLMNVPAQVFGGKISGTVLLLAVSRQVFWVIVLILGVRAIAAIAARRVVVQGG
jgi:ABC-2 type transport system permease protein